MTTVFLQNIRLITDSVLTVDGTVFRRYIIVLFKEDIGQAGLHR